MTSHAPLESVLDDRALYYTDNAALYCGAHCGVTARCSGRDISGQRVELVTSADVSDFHALLGHAPRCEQCGLEAA